MKGKMVKRLLAVGLSIAMAVTTFQTVGTSGPGIVQAASTVTNENLLKNPTFEEGVDLGTHSDSNQNNKVGNWFAYSTQNPGTVKKVQENAHNGEWSATVAKQNDALEQDVPDLQKGATYKLSVWAKNTNPSGLKTWLCLKWYGGSEKKVAIDSSEYKQYEIEFTYTGATGTDAGKNTRVAIWVERGNSGNVYVDDWSLQISSDLKSLSVENGALKAEYNADYQGEMKSSDFDISYTSSLEPEVAKKLDITSETVNGKTLTMNFAEIAKQPMKQTITVTATYKPSKQPMVVDFDVDGSGEELVEANLTGITAENGGVTANLDKVPTVAPVKDDFTLEYKVNDGAFEKAAIKEFTYNKDSKNVVMTFDKISGAVDPKDVTVKVTYKDVAKTAEFRVELGSGVKYYVDATNGKDSNNGTSPETAWQTIDRVNQEKFQPGDQILFKAGETWTGALKPQGSGVDGAPIVIASYGEGKKPILMPGEDWTISHMNIANQVVRNPKVNNVITFFNQEYWEVRDLELYDSTYEQNTNTNVYRRGINISAEDVGDLSYFKFDNLTIHGFRGPISNEGKSSGGIIMTVTTNLNDASKRVPTAVHDISVTNCELYDLGRSGINFVSPWTTREGDKWNKYAPFGYAGKGAWKPYERFTLSNNIIHDIDGDGTIVDGCKDVTVDHNTVYRAVYNCWYGVGLFNWNSDNVVFEYNEVYESSPADALLGAGDGQGIEIDALNQNTLVQYNYLHDNAGGVFMWCCTASLRGFNGIYRYNISQNDGAKHGVIDWREGHEGSMAYNNTIYLGEGIDREWLKNGYTGGKSDAKFYNNIVVNKGNMTPGKGFNEQEIDYESNIFVGFDEVPSNDTTLIQEDPKFVAPGTGGKGIDSVKGYKLQADSPAIDAGLNIENNGGKDYFGTPLADGKTDIGAAEYVVELDKTALNALIEYAKSQQENENYQYVVPVVKEKFEAALAEAEKVSADNAATQEAVDTAYDKLLDMVHHLEFTGNTSSLKVLVDAAKGLEEQFYIAESWKPFTEALKEAEAVLADENALQEEIDAVRAALKTAMDGLVKKPLADKSKLEKLVKDSETKYEPNLDKYTPASGESFKEALDAARSVLADENATQKQVDSAYTTLQKAIFGLRLIPNKEALEDLINKVESMDLSGYTTESVQALKNVLLEAKAVMEDPEADQKEVDAAEKALRASRDGLVAVEDAKKADSSKKVAKTGDATSPIGWTLAGVLAVLAVVAAFFVRRKKR